MKFDKIVSTLEEALFYRPPLRVRIIRLAIVLLFLAAFSISTSVHGDPITTNLTIVEQVEPKWGSFTDAPVTSSDGKYTASYSNMYIDEYETSMVIVDIHDAETGRLASSFIPARSSDFWGICWEDGTHNIWIQSGDIGVQCYAKVDAQ